MTTNALFKMILKLVQSFGQVKNIFSLVNFIF